MERPDKITREMLDLAFQEVNLPSFHPKNTVAVMVGIGHDGRSRANSLTAVALFQAGYADSVYCMSINRSNNSGPTEAEAMALTALDYGMPRKQLYRDGRILKFKEKDNTIKNIMGLRRPIQEHGWQTSNFCCTRAPQMAS